MIIIIKEVLSSPDHAGEANIRMSCFLRWYPAAIGYLIDFIFICSHVETCPYSIKEYMVKEHEYGSETPESVAPILRNGGSQSPDKWLRGARNNQEVIL